MNAMQRREENFSRIQNVATIKKYELQIARLFSTYLISCIWRWIKHNFEAE